MSGELYIDVNDDNEVYIECPTVQEPADHVLSPSPAKRTVTPDAPVQISKRVQYHTDVFAPDEDDRVPRMSREQLEYEYRLVLDSMKTSDACLEIVKRRCAEYKNEVRNLREELADAKYGAEMMEQALRYTQQSQSDLRSQLAFAEAFTGKVTLELIKLRRGQ